MPSVSLVVRISVPKQNVLLPDLNFIESIRKSIPLHCCSYSVTTSGWVKSDAIEYREELFVYLEWSEGSGVPGSRLIPRVFLTNLLLHVSFVFRCSVEDLREKHVYLDVFEKVV